MDFELRGRGWLCLVVVLAMAGCVLLPSVCRALEGAPRRGECAAEFPEFEQQWKKAIATAGAEEFLALMDADDLPYISDEIRMTRYSVMNIFRETGMGPWLVVGDEDLTENIVAPGGILKVVVTAAFETSPIGERKSSMTELKVIPTFPHLLGDRSQGWRQKRNEATGRPAVKGWIDQTVWISIPPSMPTMPIDIVVSAVTVGPVDGEVRAEELELKITLHSNPKAVPTRENVLCVWGFAIDGGRRLAQSGDNIKDAQKELLLNQLRWSDSFLRKCGTNDQFKELVSGLRTHPEFVTKVASVIKDDYAPAAPPPLP